MSSAWPSRWRSPFVLAAATALATAGASCRTQRTENAPALDVKVAGCAAVRAGPVCELGPSREVRLVVEAEEEAVVSVEANGVRLPAADAVALHPGVRLRVMVPAGVTAVRVTAQAGLVFRRAELQLADRISPPWFERASAARRAGDGASAEALARAHQTDAGYEGALAQGLLARLALARQEHAVADAGLARSSALHLALGRLSEAAQDAGALAFLRLEHRHDPEGAREALHSVALHEGYLPEAQAKHRYYASSIAAAAGDPRRQLALIDESEAIATRFDLASEVWLARAARAQALYEGGRRGDACRRYDELLAGTVPDFPCARMRLETNLAIAALDTLDAPSPRDGGCRRDPLPLLAAALGDATCQDDALRANAALARAEALIRRGAVAEARAALAELRLGEDAAPFVTVGAASLKGELALATGHLAGAREAFRNAEVSSLRAGMPTLAVRALLGAARTHVREGRRLAAVATLRAAEELVDELTLRVPVGEGRAALAGSLDVVTRRHVAALVDVKRNEEALATLVRSRGRGLRDLQMHAVLAGLEKNGDARRAWERAAGRYAERRAAVEASFAKSWALPARESAEASARAQQEWDEARRELRDTLRLLVPSPAATPFSPRALPEGVLLLAYQPVEAGGIAFAATRAGVQAAAVPSLAERTAEEAVAAWLAPFAQQMQKATMLRVLVPEELGDLDLYAVLWRGAPLVAHLPVELALTGEPREPSHPSQEQPPGHRARALVVADPRGDLPAARVEGVSTADALRRVGEVELLAQGEATRARVRSALAGASLFHFAGHGEHLENHAWSAALVLGEGGRLDVGDIVSLASPPLTVVLAACEGSQESDDALGIGQAFLLAGSTAVVAAPRAVDDHLVRAFVEAFYAALRRGESVVTAVRTAALHVRSAGFRDWSAFRAYSP